jgi:ferredoxin
MEGRPYPERDFDINLSALKDSYLVEVATDKGRRIVNEFRTFFINSDRSNLNIRDERRKRIASQIEEFIAKRGTPDAKQLAGAVRKNRASEIWKDFSSTCVECGACNLVCPTCHCFLLFDEKSSEDRPRRYKIWDSCLYKTFARVAGGANPRKRLEERLRNRFEKKFEFFPAVLNAFACTGCGRCVEACPGDIDIREVLKGLVAGKWRTPPNR